MARRREDGVDPRSLLRQLAGLRSFSRYLTMKSLRRLGVFRQGRARPRRRACCPSFCRREKLKTLRRANWLKERPDRRGSAPATLRSFRCSTERAYVFPRPCRSDGLRRRSAMSSFPEDQGKRRKVRAVPVILPARRAVETYLELCPFALAPDSALFGRARGGALVARIIQLTWNASVARLACPILRRRMRYDIPSPRTFLGGAEICAPSRSFSAMPACRPRKSTPRSTRCAARRLSRGAPQSVNGGKAQLA